MVRTPQGHGVNGVDMMMQQATDVVNSVDPGEDGGVTDPAGAEQPARPSTRASIERSARRLFGERGFGGTSVRDIGRAAGVDAALVIRHFGSKEALFVAIMSMDGNFSAFTDVPLDGLGRAVVRRLIGRRDDSARRFYTALMRAADRPAIRDAALASISASIVDPLSARLAGPDARLRARLVAAQVIGLLNGLWVLDDPDLLGADQEALIARYGDAVQALVDDPGDAA